MTMISLDYTAYSTSFGIDLKIFKDAIFNNMHESLHFGYVMGTEKSFWRRILVR